MRHKDSRNSKNKNSLEPQKERFLKGRLEAELTILNRMIAKAKSEGGCASCGSQSISSLREIVIRCKKQLGLPTDDVPGKEFETKRVD